VPQLASLATPLLLTPFPPARSKGVGRKFSREEPTKKKPKISKKYRKIALFSHFRGERATEK